MKLLKLFYSNWFFKKRSSESAAFDPFAEGIKELFKEMGYKTKNACEEQEKKLSGSPANKTNDDPSFNISSIKK